ncbi:DUF1616 domain-containing protein [Haladaptatus caseinilyticus]|uniref:DUF1616 domain-containing protein n=1 Tax=Haladaptatus caseinilyticus TaxID=2993314 RepID=UPI00224B76D0|nr:DUF1616 domain-containing protein [Haladaptatus caseinilyticus]
MSDTSDSHRALRLFFTLVMVDVFSVLGAIAPFAPGIREQPIRLVLTLPLLLFFPGYAVVTALLPVADGGKSNRSNGTVAIQFDELERNVFAIGISVLLVAAIALTLDHAGIGIRAVPVTVSAGVCTFAASVVAALRLRTVGDRCLGDSIRNWWNESRRRVRTPKIAPRLRSNLDRRLNVVLVLLILASVGSIGFALAGLDHTESYTTMSLLTKNGSEMVPPDGRSLVRSDEPRDLRIGVENHEGRTVRYTVIVQRQQVAADDPTSVTNRRTLERFRVTLTDGERRQLDYSAPPTVVGNRQRVAFLLYKGGPPPTPTMDSAAQETHLWTTPANESKTTRRGERG